MRTGISISDEKESYAIPLQTVLTKGILDVLLELRERESIDLVVLGYPLSLKGHTNQMTREVEDFKVQLVQKGFEVQLFDERLSTRRAQASLHEAGVSARKQKKLKDEMAASILLQDFLDSKRGK
ncbi:Holliday junction resolvase RuvX [bacterium]|nr:Holliday junction resolvase RuvX [bacterium]